MKINLTLVRSGGEQTDLTVTAEPTTPIVDIARAVYDADPERPGEPLSNADRISLRLHRIAPDGSGTAQVLDYATPLADSSIAGGAYVSLANAIEAREGHETRREGAAKITVLSGADDGREFSIGYGSSSIGRDAGQDVRLQDPLVSKAHARLNISDVAEIIDQGSANGTRVNGELITRANVTRNDVVTVGSTSFMIELAALGAAADLGGVVALNRSPRLDPQYPGRELIAPDPPERPKPRPLPWMMFLVPLLMGPLMLAMGRSPYAMVFMLMMPLMATAMWLDGKRRNAKEWKQARIEFAAAVDGTADEIDAEHAIERAGRLSEAPSVPDIIDDAMERGPLLWTRRPEHAAFGMLRLGIGAMPSRVELKMPTQKRGIPEMWRDLRRLEEHCASVADVPVTENLRTSGSIGVAGQRAVAVSVARSLVIQLTGLHSPAELVIHATASTESARDWQWLRWLPHVTGGHSPVEAEPLAAGTEPVGRLVTGIEDLIEARAGTQERPDPEGPPRLPLVVLVVEDDTPIERARLIQIAERGPSFNVHVLWVAPALARIPAACRTYLELSPASGDAVAGFVKTGLGVQPVVAALVNHHGAELFARALTPVEDASARIDDASDLPRAINFLTIVGPELGEQPQAILDRWAETHSILTGPLASKQIGRQRSTLRAVFGMAAGEPFQIDLRSDGPHALVGGTTGSGKSEFLQAWVLGMATAHSPQRVSFLFVDYKGGSAFADCTNLPHCVGIVTDLSQHMVYRALTSLRAELHYREHLFNRMKVKDLIELERTGTSEVPPALIIIVDEFAALVNEVPEFVDGMVDIAQRGRSLGLHMVLATQRPAGVIKDNLRANTNLRIALRMADEEDSKDILGTKMAAHFDSSTPGRGAAKTGPGRIRAFQSGYAGGWTSSVKEPSRVLVEELRFGRPRQWEPPRDPDADRRKEELAKLPNDMKRIVRTVVEAADAAEIPALRKPWLPELHATYDLAELPNAQTDTEILLGVCDKPTEQAQPTMSWYPDRDGNFAIFGTGGSGKSSALRTFAVSSALTRKGGPVHVYGIDYAGGALTMLETLPHVGAVIPGDDEDRSSRLLRTLKDEIDDRVLRYAAARAATITEYRQIANAPQEPRILLLVDGFRVFRELYEGNMRVPIWNLFQQIASDGRQVGVSVILTTDRIGGLPQALNSSIQRRMVLRLPTRDDYVSAGVPRDILSPASPPGRGVVDGLELQLAVLGGDPNVAVQSRRIDALAAAMRKAGIPEAPGVAALAEVVPFRALGEQRPDAIAIGIADATLAPLAIEPAGALIVTGPPGTGKTTALVTIGTAVRTAKPASRIYLLSGRRSTIAHLDIWSHATHDFEEILELTEDLQDELASGQLQPGELTVVLEYLADFGGTPLERRLEPFVKELVKQDQFVVAENELNTWNQIHGISAALRAKRRGLIMQPAEGEADNILSTPLGRIKRGSLPVGRGFYVAQAKAHKLQVGMVDAD